MESKTIRFEKGKEYNLADIYPIKLSVLDPHNYVKYSGTMFNVEQYIALKSFTVQINIIEDENSI